MTGREAAAREIHRAICPGEEPCPGCATLAGKAVAALAAAGLLAALPGPPDEGAGADSPSRCICSAHGAPNAGQHTAQCLGTHYPPLPAPGQDGAFYDPPDRDYSDGPLPGQEPAAGKDYQVVSDFPYRSDYGYDPAAPAPGQVTAADVRDLQLEE